jgi:hypothetical protein
MDGKWCQPNGLRTSFALSRMAAATVINGTWVPFRGTTVREVYSGRKRSVRWETSAALGSCYMAALIRPIPGCH